jgi:oligopeptidase B
VKAPVADPQKKHWREVVAHRPLVMLEEVDLFRDFWVMLERDKGLLKLRVTDFDSGKSHYIAFDEEVYSAHPSVNAEYETTSSAFSTKAW